MYNVLRHVADSLVLLSCPVSCRRGEKMERVNIRFYFFFFLITVIIYNRTPFHCGSGSGNLGRMFGGRVGKIKSVASIHLNVAKYYIHLCNLGSEKLDDMST